jgi:outer membrane biosynthesis protein TonB
MWIVWVGCASIKAPPTSAAELLDLLAAPPSPPGHPPRESLDAYLEEVTGSVRARAEPCVDQAGDRRGETGVVATIDQDGRVVALTVVRSSGSEPHDVCVLDAFRRVELPSPPREVLAGGRLVTPRLSFR